MKLFLLLYHLCAATGKCTGRFAFFARTLEGSLCGIPAFLDNLELESAILADIDLTFSHLMTARHSSSLLSL